MPKQRKRNQKKPGGEKEERRGKEGKSKRGKGGKRERESLRSSLLASNFYIIPHLDRELLLLTK